MPRRTRTHRLEWSAAGVLAPSLGLAVSLDRVESVVNPVLEKI